jgi:hypothetical protein
MPASHVPLAAASPGSPTSLYRLLWLREHDKRSYDENLALGRRYTIDWDDPAFKMPASESSPFK